jgi:aspartokinase/homoserine dehydrogenase 1
VLRKTLILARVAGLPLEEKDVAIKPFPKEKELEAAYAEASASGRKLRYVARLTGEGKATVGLLAVGPESPLYSLTGTDNCAVITTGDYPSPLVIRGAGAGPRQTAAGVLQDILSL